MKDIRVIELFAGMGGFRIGLEKASARFKTIWSNQWEPSTKRQDASLVYCKCFGKDGHVNQDISSIAADEIPEAELLCAGFPCQDYSVATTLANSKGIEGKKGVLWWQIHRILKDKGQASPPYLVLENVDRLLASPAKQRGRDFALILASLADLGYWLEWRVVNAAEYGMPQRRKRVYIIAYHQHSNMVKNWNAPSIDPYQWIMSDWMVRGSILGKALPCIASSQSRKSRTFALVGDLLELSNNFNCSPTAKPQPSPFVNAGMMRARQVWTLEVKPVYAGHFSSLGEHLLAEDKVPETYFIPAEDLAKWAYLKGSKTQKRVTKTGNEYHYSEGSMVFPDALDKPTRTIITGEGGASPSRFKHVVQTPSGRYRRLVPVELERLNMFPDCHTEGVSDSRRAFLMGNALVTGIIERIGSVLQDNIE